MVGPLSASDLLAPTGEVGAMCGAEQKEHVQQASNGVSNAYLLALTAKRRQLIMPWHKSVEQAAQREFVDPIAPAGGMT
ncbi:hypothetical protein [Burkholderia ubonensis]|uniref:hypothetical protein n=1 Tax=Burkholderia ubonensis TaxID=101571 RepID=UPI000759479C|nr:hypothetical protein [Burkholderia ubonensis]KVQ13419.1 hypothetical protein WJ98_27435 [Burkholderia ubonensis]